MKDIITIFNKTVSPIETPNIGHTRWELEFGSYKLIIAHIDRDKIEKPYHWHIFNKSHTNNASGLIEEGYAAELNESIAQLQNATREYMQKRLDKAKQHLDEVIDEARLFGIM